MKKKLLLHEIRLEFKVDKNPFGLQNQTYENKW